MKTLKELRDALVKAKADLAELRGKAYGEKATDADVSAYEAKLQEAEGLLKQIRTREREEALDGAEADEANREKEARGGVGHNGGVPFAEVAEQEVPKEAKTLIGIAAAHKSALIQRHYGEKVDAFKLLESEGYGKFAKELKHKAQREFQKAAGANGVLSTVSGGVLLPQPVTANVIPILRPETIFLQGNPQRRQLVGGVYRQPRGVGSSTANYIGEAELKPVGTVSFDDIDMRSHKLAGIVYISDEALKWSIIDLEAYIRQDLALTMGLKMDAAAFFGTGAGAIPLGILNQPGITIIDASAAGTFADPKNPTYTELDALASRLTLALTMRNIARTGQWRWTMGYRFMQYLIDMRDGNGNAIYPTVETQRTWKGIPILVSTSIAENGGATTDEGTLSLIDFRHVLMAEEESMTFKSSTEATIKDGDTTVFLWQQNMSAVLAEMAHDFTVDQPSAVAKAIKVRAGA